MPNPQLLEYVRQVEAQGYPPEQMRDVLLQAGWPVEQVDEALGDTSFKIAAVKPRLSAETARALLRQRSQPVVQPQPRAVKVVALLLLIFGGVGVLIGAALIIGGSAALRDVPVIGGKLAAYSLLVTSFWLVGSVTQVIAGVGLWLARRWAWTLALVACGLGAFTVVLLPVYAALAFVLLRRQVRASFS